MTKKQTKSPSTDKTPIESTPITTVQPPTSPMQQANAPDSVNQFGTSMPQQKISKGLLWAIGIGFGLVNLVLIALYIWADYYEHPDEYKEIAEATNGSVDPMILVLIAVLSVLFVMLPTLIIALVVWLKLRKKK